MNTAAIQVLVGIAIAAASSWITVQLSLGKFRKEKWWERKVSAYERIIEALHACKAYAEAYLVAMEEHRELPEEQQQELSKRAKAAHLELSKAIDCGGFILSDEAHIRLMQYRKESQDAQRNMDFYSYVEDDFSATERCLSDVILIAKKDLQTMNPWRWVTRRMGRGSAAPGL